MTYSGSILLLGPPEEGVRIATYSSVGGRSGVPTTAEHEAAVLVTDLVINDVVEFSPGPVARTSEIYKIGVCRTNVAIEEQSARLAEFAGELRADFKELNQTFLGECQ